MLAKLLYDKLDRDFEIRNMKDDWSYMSFNKYISPSFRRQYMGIILDNASEIKKVFSITFPDKNVLQEILDRKEQDILIFSHHPMGYNPTSEGFPFYNIPVETLQKLKDQRISLYALHTPLDKNGRYSTSVNLARNLNLQVAGEFCEDNGIQCGVICNTDAATVNDFAESVRNLVGHEVKILKNGDEHISGGQVAIVSGAGNVGFAAREIAELRINLYLTGCTRKVLGVEPIMDFHCLIKEHGINVIGATHYSTEKYSSIAMVQYFKKLELEAEFIEGSYWMEDL